MYTQKIYFGSKMALISANSYRGPFTTRLYVNLGETPTTNVRKARTQEGAKKQAFRMLGVSKVVDTFRVRVE